MTRAMYHIENPEDYLTHRGGTIRPMTPKNNEEKHKMNDEIIKHNIELENNEPGKGKSRGSKKTKTIKQLIEEINVKKTETTKIFNRPKQNEQPQYVYSTSSTNSSNKK